MRLQTAAAQRPEHVSIQHRIRSMQAEQLRNGIADASTSGVFSER
jgi:hypothetical protein